MIGQSFGRLTVIERSGKSSPGRVYWECRCNCGTVKPIRSDALTSGASRSCGCFQKENAVSVMSDVGKRNKRHGHSCQNGSPTLTYRSWSSMMTRCYNKKHEHYCDYGGRGIAVCDSWHTFDNFLADMGDRPSKSMTLDRIDVNKGYCLDNCRWASKVQQNRNSRGNIVVHFRGESRCISEWAKVLGLSSSAVYQRILNGWSGERAITQPIQKKSRKTASVKQ